MAILQSPTAAGLLQETRDFLNQPEASNSFWSDVEILRYLNDGVRRYFSEVVQNAEGQFTTFTTLDIVSGQDSINLPSDFFEIKALYKVVINGFVVLPYINAIQRSYYNNSGGTGNSYTPYYEFRGNQLVVHPIPDYSETGGLRLEYIYFPTTLVNGGDTLTAQVSPIFKDLIVMYAVYKAKVKEGLVNGSDLAVGAKEHLADLYAQFKDVIKNRSKYPQYIEPFNPEGSLM